MAYIAAADRSLRLKKHKYCLIVLPGAPLGAAGKFLG